MLIEKSNESIANISYMMQLEVLNTTVILLNREMERTIANGKKLQQVNEVLYFGDYVLIIGRWVRNVRM